MPLAFRTTTPASAACCSAETPPNLQHLASAKCRANPVPHLVGERAVEPPEALLAFADLGLGQFEESHRRRLLDEYHGLEESLGAGEDLAAAARHVNVVNRPDEEGEQDASQELELLENLVFAKTLRVAEGAELTGTKDDSRVGEDQVLGLLDEVGDPGDEERHVVEQIVCREDSLRVQRHPVGDALEPSARELHPRVTEQRGEGCRQGAIRHAHGGMVTEG